MSSSPSTRFDGSDICGKAADELPIRCVALLKQRTALQRFVHCLLLSDATTALRLRCGNASL
jgi:hypothetical protein